MRRSHTDIFPLKLNHLPGVSQSARERAECECECVRV